MPTLGGRIAVNRSDANRPGLTARRRAAGAYRGSVLARRCLTAVIATLTSYIVMLGSCRSSDVARADPPSPGPPSAGAPTALGWPSVRDCKDAQTRGKHPGTTQFDMNVGAGADAIGALCRMHKAYDDLRRSLGSDADATAKLETAQQSWVAYRTAHLAERFPHQDDSLLYYGSVFPMCWSLEQAGLNGMRVEELRNARKCTGAESTIEQATDAAHAADALLNKSYGKALSVYADDPVFVAAFRRAEIAWLKFRDALVTFAAALSHGSDSVCAQRSLERVTRERVREIGEWLHPHEEDLCQGSYRTSM